MPSLTNVAAYSIQLAVLVIAALAIARAVRLRDPLASLRFWQAIFIISLVLPLVQPRDGDRVMLSSTALAPFVATAPINALATSGGDIAQWIVLIVVSGMAIRMLWLGIGVARLRRITGSAAFDPSLDPLLRELTAAVHTDATIAITDAVEGPATVGFRRPMILLPRRVLGMTPAVQRAVIAHELVHVRRRDWLHTLAEEIWCALLWFHPAARLIASRLSLARETLVDQTTILLTRDRRAYAEALLAFANPQPYLPGVTPFVGRRHLSQRISLIAEEAIMSRSRIVASLAVALAISAAATAGAAVTFPFSSTPDQSTKVYKPGPGITLPKVVREVKPAYTPGAMERKIKGNVIMDVVVLETGDVGDVTIAHSLDEELDQQAITAMKQWKFQPGARDDIPVAVQVVVQMTFTLKP